MAFSLPSLFLRPPNGLLFLLSKFLCCFTSVGIGGGSWKDYVDSDGNLVMTLKISGDTEKDLNEIYDAFILWGDTQKRFTGLVEQYNGVIYLGSTNVWISKQNGYVKMVLSQNINIIDEISSQLGEL